MIGGLELEAKQKAAEAEENKKELSERKPNTHPSHELKDYAGRYENSGYGVITIQLSGDGLSFPLHHYEYDVFEAPPTPPELSIWASCGF